MYFPELIRQSVLIRKMPVRDMHLKAGYVQESINEKKGKESCAIWIKSLPSALEGSIVLVGKSSSSLDALQRLKYLPDTDYLYQEDWT